MKRLTGALIFVFGASLLYLGFFGLQGFGLKISLVGEYFKDDFNDLSQWTWTSGQQGAAISPAGFCSFNTTASSRYSHSLAAPVPASFSVELKLRVIDWGSKAEFYLWFQSQAYAYLLSINATHIRVATPAPAIFQALVTDNSWHTWTWTVDGGSSQQRVYRDGSLVGSWNSLYGSTGATYYLSFNSGNSYTLKTSMDYLYIDLGVKPPTAPAVRNSLQVRGRFGGSPVGSFTVTLRNSSYVYPVRTAASTDGVTYSDLVTAITWTANATYLLHPASNSCVLPTSPTPYVLWLDFGAAPPAQGSIQVVGYENGVPVSGFEAWYTNGTESAHKTAATTSGVSFSNLKTGITYTIHGTKGSVTAPTKDIAVVNPTNYDTTLTFDSTPPQVGSVRVLGKQSGNYISGFEAWLTNGTAWSSSHITATVPTDGAYFTNLAAGTYTVHGKLDGVEASTNTTQVVLPQSQVPTSVVTFAVNPPPEDWLEILKAYLADPTVKAGLQWVGGLFSLMGLLIMLFGGEKKQRQPVYVPPSYW